MGVHAEFEQLTLLTRDVGRYRTYFPAVRLIVPNGGSPAPERAVPITPGPAAVLPDAEEGHPGSPGTKTEN